MKKLSTTLKKIILTLNDLEFHSGESLGTNLNITRNAVWKHMNQLTKYEIPLESAQSKGYRFKQPLFLLNEKTIKKNLSYAGTFTPKKIEVLGSISSTNDYLKIPIASQAPIRICLAEQQTAGRGRFGRTWYSPFAANIYLSCSWRITHDVSKLNGLSLAIALAVIKTIKECGVKKDLKIKWPNDILFNEQKLAGILMEMNAESHGVTQVIIGIGINTNMPATAEHNVDRPWASLNKILGDYQDRNKVAGLLISHLLQSLEEFHHAGFAHFIKDWQRYDYLLGKKISLQIAKNSLSGIARGINEYGHLLLQCLDGEVLACSAGDATLSHF